MLLQELPDILDLELRWAIFSLHCTFYKAPTPTLFPPIFKNFQDSFYSNILLATGVESFKLSLYLQDVIEHK